MKRYDLLNWFIQHWGYRSYLEIGIDRAGNCHDRVQCEHKVGVDPAIGKTVEAGNHQHYRMTSDAFFAGPGARMKFDIVFVDGLHIRSQVVRDVDNSLRCLNPGGVIILHDCIPDSVGNAGDVRLSAGPWYGTVWQAWAELRATRPNLDMHCVSADCGLGIIEPGIQKLYHGPFANYEDFVANRHEILMSISPDEVAEYYA